LRGGASSFWSCDVEESWEVTGRRSTRLMGISIPSIVHQRAAYHNGHVPDTFNNQGSTHSGWNLWLQGSTRRSWPFSKSSVQIEHPRASSDDALSVPAPTPVAAGCAGAMPDWCSSDSLGVAACIVLVESGNVSGV
jgi:hypothetical protein